MLKDVELLTDLVEGYDDHLFCDLKGRNRGGEGLNP